MSTPREAAVRALFEQAASLEGEERARLLRDSRSTDPELAQEVESLLTFHDEHDALLDAPPVTQIVPPGQPARIGGYEIIGELGRGGMGIVYEARQASPRRLVALKVIAEDGPPGPLARRLEREAEMLALLDHPGIAQVYEAGVATDDAGRARMLVAMELVRGPTLREFARETRLPVPVKLELAAKIADAVDHAHRRGVIHRDLKPENIVVLGGEPEQPPGHGGALPRTFAALRPKVLDFGIARMIGVGSGSIAATLAGQIVGTLEFMSPEQAAGDPRHVDTRSDVYSLGAILHELLVGTPPISVAGMGITGAIAAICQQSPARLSSIDPDLRGDIESIVQKALDKEPSQRYASAAEFAQDIRRHLADQPVLAHPPTAWYQFVRFARRRRGLVAGVALGAGALLCTSGLAAWQAYRATKARDQAASEAMRATQTTEFLRRTLLMATPEGAAGRSLTVRELLDVAARDLETTGGVSPAVATQTHRLLAEAYFALSEFKPSEEHARKAVAAGEVSGGPSSEEALKARAALGLALANQHRGQEALPMLEPALLAAKSSLGPTHSVVIELLRATAAAKILQPAPEAAEGERIAREGLRLARETLGEDDDHTVLLTQALAMALGLSGSPEKLKEAVALDRALLAARAGRLGEDHPRVLLVAMDLSTLLSRAGEREQVAELLKKHLPAARRVLGAEHAGTIRMENELAESLQFTGKAEDSIPLYLHVYQHRLNRTGGTSMETLMARDALAEALLATGRCESAAAVLQEQEAAKAIVGEGNVEPRLTFLRFCLANCQGDLPAMTQLAERLRGTPDEAYVRDQLEKVRRRAGKSVGSGDDRR